MSWKINHIQKGQFSGHDVVACVRPVSHWEQKEKKKDKKVLNNCLKDITIEGNVSWDSRNPEWRES